MIIEYTYWPDERLGWNDADKFCKTRGEDLVSITNRQEHEFVWHLANAAERTLARVCSCTIGIS